jgi:hypothetical protein
LRTKPDDGTCEAINAAPTISAEAPSPLRTLRAIEANDSGSLLDRTLNELDAEPTCCVCSLVRKFALLAAVVKLPPSLTKSRSPVSLAVIPPVVETSRLFLRPDRSSNAFAIV